MSGTSFRVQIIAPCALVHTCSPGGRENRRPFTFDSVARKTARGRIAPFVFHHLEPPLMRDVVDDLGRCGKAGCRSTARQTCWRHCPHCLSKPRYDGNNWLLGVIFFAAFSAYTGSGRVDACTTGINIHMPRSRYCVAVEAAWRGHHGATRWLLGRNPATNVAAGRCVIRRSIVPVSAMFGANDIGLLCSAVSGLTPL